MRVIFLLAASPPSAPCWPAAVARSAPPPLTTGRLLRQYVRRGRPARRAKEVDTVLQRRDGHHLRDGLQQLQHGATRGPQPEPAQGVARPLQEHMEQQVSARDGTGSLETVAREL